MKRSTLLFLLLTVPLIHGAVWAQEDSTVSRLSDYRGRVGIRLGVNQADMVYTHSAVDRYSHLLNLRPTGGFYVGSRLGKSPLAIGLEALYMGRGTRLSWLDVNYRLATHNVDLRLPVSYSFFGLSDSWAPYVMVAPWVGATLGGRIDYTAYDYPDGVSREVTTANMKPMDFGVMAGVGAEWLTHLGKTPLVLAVEAGYNVGIPNVFVDREKIENLANGNPSVIANPFFGAELWHNTRHSRGIEAVVRVSIPFGRYKKPAVVETKEEGVMYESPEPTPNDMMSTLSRMPMTEAIVEEDSIYVVKDCYTIPEMSAFLTLGYDISDKRICLFDINFDFDSYNLRPESDKPLNEVLMMMKTHPDVSVAVYGHTDSIGTIDYNQRLSENRAQAVVNWLVEHGIAPERIYAEGFGEEFPMDTNETEEGRFHNRRVEFDVRVPRKK